MSRYLYKWVGEESGFTLVEALVALAILCGVIIPMLDFSASISGGAPFARQDAVGLATSKLEELEAEAYRQVPWPTQNTIDPETGQPIPMVDNPPKEGRYEYQRSWIWSAYTPASNDNPVETTKLRQLSVTVTCLNCPRPMSPVKVVAVVGKAS